MQGQITLKTPVTIRDQQRNVYDISQIGGDIQVNGGAINFVPTHWPIRDELTRLAGRDLFYISPEDVDGDEALKSAMSTIRDRSVNIVQNRINNFNLNNRNEVPA